MKKTDKQLKDNNLYDGYKEAMEKRYGQNWEVHVYTHSDMANAYIDGATSVLKALKVEAGLKWDNNEK